MEGIDQAVITDLPGLGNAGHRFQGGAVLEYQSLHQRADNFVLRHAGGYMGIQALGFGAITPVQDSLAVSLLDPTLTAVAGG